MKILRQSMTATMTGQDLKMAMIQAIQVSRLNVLDIEEHNDFVEKNG